MHGKTVQLLEAWGWKKCGLAHPSRKDVLLLEPRGPAHRVEPIPTHFGDHLRNDEPGIGAARDLRHLGVPERPIQIEVGFIERVRVHPALHAHWLINLDDDAIHLSVRREDLTNKDLDALLGLRERILLRDQSLLSLRLARRRCPFLFHGARRGGS
jgi:hypothetical protein